jgi:hypothetical protein
LALAALLLVVVVVRTAVKRRATSAVRTRTFSPALMLHAAARELSAVKSATQHGGWSGELAGRAAAALRLAGAIALGKPVSQREVARGTTLGEGQIAVRRGLRGKKIALSAAVTSGTPSWSDAPASRTAIWEGISQTLAIFTAARYSRSATLHGADGTLDGTALDTALADGQDLVRRLRRHQLVRLGKTKTRAPESAKPTWAR